ncbi:MAG TPA: pectate lyase, partial [Thermoguttaceae bacterium]|nr:pectate lyase [Thermoguttaceae bacterium]
DAPPDPAQFPVKQAEYPDTWPREYPGVKYSACYTFNDNAISDVIDVMFEASRTYENPEYAEAARRAGDFILLAQMPEPQPAWAQQYNAAMHPVWARKFEPASVTGGESQGVMRTLMQIYRETGDKRYLEPIPRAIAYLRRSQLPGSSINGGRLARFYELKTNRPLYFTKDYRMTYSDDDMPTHYSFQISSSLDRIERQYRQLLQLSIEQLEPRPSDTRRRATPDQMAQVRQVIDALDDRGRWVESGRLKYYGDDDPTRRVIDCRTFVENLQTLSAYLATTPASSETQ